MTRERFEKLLYDMEEFNDYIDELSGMGIDIERSLLSRLTVGFFEDIMRGEYGENGLETINRWLYCVEPSEGGDSLETIDDLYDYLETGLDTD